MKKRITAFMLAGVLGITAVINGNVATVSAQERSQDTAVNNAKSKMIYIRTLASEGGNGSEEKPFNDFKTAYRHAGENDTLVLLNSVTIQNDDNSSDRGVFTFNKAVKIKGDNTGNGTLTSRVSIQLGADIKFENMEFDAKNIYLNGYTLDMTNVKNNKNSLLKPSVYGGAYQNSAAGNGTKSVLRVYGYAGEAFKFKTIYAGSETGESDIPVTLDLIKGINVEDGIYAGGLNGKVNRNVEFNIGQIFAAKFENNHASPDTKIVFNGYVETDGAVLKGFNDVTLKNSRIKVINTAESGEIKGKLELDSKSMLDISDMTSPLSVGSFAGEEGSMLMINSAGKLEVKGELTGAVELRTPGLDVAVSGTVKKDHVYISAARTSGGEVAFKPFFNQRKLELKEEDGQITKTWVIRNRQIDNPVDKIDVIEDKKIKIDRDIEQEFTLKYSDKNGNNIQYEPQFEYTVIDPAGKIVDDNGVAIDISYISEWMLVYIYDDELKTGVYTVVLTEVVSDRVFKIPFIFYKENQPASYTVEFNANGGSGNMIHQPIELNTSANLNKNKFAREGYIFKGWSKQADGNVEYTDEQEIQNLAYAADEKVVLYAVWSREESNKNEVPTISASDKVLTAGDRFNPLEGATAHDKEDGDTALTDSNIIENDVDINKPGTYSVSYRVTDSKGVSAEKTIAVTVVAEAAEKPAADDRNNLSAAKTDNPVTGKSLKTGDSTNMMIWPAAMFTSFSLLAALAIRKSYKKQ